MTPQQLVGTALRLAALWLVLIAFQMFAIVQAGFQAAAFATTAIPLMAICLLPALALACWLFPMMLAHKVLPVPRAAQAVPVTLQDACAALAVVVGIYAICSALPSLCSALLLHLFGVPDAIALYLRTRGVDVLGYLSRFGVGLGLILLARPLAQRIFPPQAHSS